MSTNFSAGVSLTNRLRPPARCLNDGTALLCALERREVWSASPEGGDRHAARPAPYLALSFAPAASGVGESSMQAAGGVRASRLQDADGVRESRVQDADGVGESRVQAREPRARWTL
jgi:hypothetical protein